MRRLGTMLLIAAAVAVAACSSPSKPEPAAAAAPSAPVYKPVLTLNDIMVSVIDSNSHKLWDVEDKTPTTEQWAELEHAAVTLAAGGSLTAVSGNGPKDQQWTAQPDWQKYSEAVSTAGLEAVKAVRAKDTSALKLAGDHLVLTCINCHREYKLEVPKVWSDHEQVH